MSTDDVPPFIHHCAPFLSGRTTSPSSAGGEAAAAGVAGDCELPLIDVSSLLVWPGRVEERRRCVATVADASSEWGFFQVVNHGVSREVLEEMRRAEEELFKLPFEAKSTCTTALHGSYRWGAPTATSLQQFSWSEAFHVPLSVVSEPNPQHWPHHDFTSFREVMGRLAKAMWKLVEALAEALAENLGEAGGGGLPAESCRKETCFLRLNRYPRCPYSPEVTGLTPHTDSDFLTVVWQDQVGGLQLLRDNSRWVAVRPNPDALIVNIGDLFQAWSNGVYKSVEHKVVSNGEAERYSIAYFMCPPYDTLVGSCKQPSIYRSFTFGEYRRQVQEDVRRSGNKLGLRRFLINNNNN